MKDTVTRITFLWVGLGRRAGGFRDPFGFLGIFFFLAKNSVVFLCTKFCLKSRADDSFKKKEKERVCICILPRTLLCDSISAASVKGLIFV